MEGRTTYSNCRISFVDGNKDFGLDWIGLNWIVLDCIGGVLILMIGFEISSGIDF